MKKTSLFFAAIIFIAFLIVTITRCRKAYSYEGGPPAIYSLVGAPNECMETKIDGNYYTAIATDLNNTVQLIVNVTAVGNYNIVTNSVNGISFSSSGNFTDTGYKAVILNCAGTPDSAGLFTFTIPGDNGCHFSLSVIDQPGADYILSGTSAYCETPVINGDYITGTAFSASNTVTINVSVITTGKYTITTDTVNGVSFSASGSFTATGDQQIILTGFGKPNSPGLIYFNLHAGSSQCTFVIPMRNIDPLAVYVLESGFGNPNPCTPHSIQGNYVANTLLNNSNTITIEVYVTIVGNYCISTYRDNGILFESSGAFTNMGEQSIVLYGNGTPTAFGKYTFLPKIVGPDPLGGNTCGVDLTIQ